MARYQKQSACGSKPSTRQVFTILKSTPPSSAQRSVLRSSASVSKMVRHHRLSSASHPCPPLKSTRRSDTHPLVSSTELAFIHSARSLDSIPQSVASHPSNLSLTLSMTARQKRGIDWLRRLQLPADLPVLNISVPSQ